MPPHESPLIVVLGPTGAGKGELGLHLAQRFGGEIINCDSVQVYRGLDIGSSKTPATERRGIRHKLIDILNVDEHLTAGSYARLARRAISEVHSDRHVPIVVGGTGFYLRALLEGLSPAPGRDEQLRERLAALAARHPNALHRFLRRYDPPAADRIHANDHQKLIRAIELTIIARQPASCTQSLPREPIRGVHVLRLGLLPDRSLLYQHLNERSSWMFASGLLAETKTLLDFGYSPSAKPLQSLGYKQAVKALQGELSIEAAILECQSKTRHYAKRQLTWFRAQTGIEWLHGFGRDETIQKLAAERARLFLSTFD